MRRLPFTVRARVASSSDAAPLLRDLGDAVLVERGRPRLIVTRCPCGCGDLLTINLDARVGKAWRYYDFPERPAVFPSVWRDSGCGSHFVVWRGYIYLFSLANHGGEDEDLPSSGRYADDRVIYDALPTETFEHYVAMADRLMRIPWDVLSACRRLQRKGAAIESPGGESGYFRRSAEPELK